MRRSMVLWLTEGLNGKNKTWQNNLCDHVRAGADALIFLRTDQFTGELIGKENTEKLLIDAATAIK